MIRIVARVAHDEVADALSRPLERDRGVDETGGQIAVFGRIGSRPFNLEEMRQFYLDPQGKPWTVSDEVDESTLVTRKKPSMSSAALDTEAPAVTPYAGEPAASDHGGQ